MSSYYEVWTDRWCESDYDDNYLMDTFRSLDKAIALIENLTRDINPKLKEWDDDHNHRCDVYYEDADGRFGDYGYWIEEKEIPPVYLVWQVMKPDKHEYDFKTATKYLVGAYDTEDHARETLDEVVANTDPKYCDTAERESEPYYRYLMVHDGFGMPLSDYWIEEREVLNQ